MAIQPAICSGCGGAINVDDVDLNGFAKCEYCGVSHKVIDIITVDGLPTVKSLLQTAYLTIDNGNYEKAEQLFNEAIKIKPNCHEAWWGVYICHANYDAYYNYTDKYGNSGPITKAVIMNESINKYAAKAIDYAPPAQADEYRGLLADKLAYIEKARSGAFDTKSKSGSSGCYIATAVYGSYESDEVFALRRFRDERLSKNAFGRAFIRVYYKLSPSLAKRLPYDSPISNRIRAMLDSFIKRIEQK